MKRFMGSFRPMTAAYRVLVFHGRCTFRNQVLQSNERSLCSSSSSSPSLIRFSFKRQQLGLFRTLGATPTWNTLLLSLLRASASVITPNSSSSYTNTMSIFLRPSLKYKLSGSNIWKKLVLTGINRDDLKFTASFSGLGASSSVNSSSGVSWTKDGKGVPGIALWVSLQVGPKASFMDEKLLIFICGTRTSLLYILLSQPWAWQLLLIPEKWDNHLNNT